MKRLLFAVAVSALVATGVSFTAARWLARHAAQSLPAIHATGWLQRELDLTESQAAAIARLEAAYREKIILSCAAHCGARLELGAELQKPEADLSAAVACVDRMCAAQAEAERATFEQILRVRELLTPVQRQRYAVLINRQFCVACPLGLHTP
jgi:Spy/CpxP family protein refolding chaperone